MWNPSSRSGRRPRDPVRLALAVVAVPPPDTPSGQVSRSAPGAHHCLRSLPLFTRVHPGFASPRHRGRATSGQPGRNWPLPSVYARRTAAGASRTAATSCLLENC